MPEATKMVLFRRKGHDEAGAKVDEARFQVQLALLEMDKVLDRVLEQAEQAKEELGERRTG